VQRSGGTQVVEPGLTLGTQSSRWTQLPQRGRGFTNRWLAGQNVLPVCPAPVRWQAIVCRVDTCRVSRNFYIWTFRQHCACKPRRQATLRRKPCPEYPARSSLFRSFYINRALLMIEQHLVAEAKDFAISSRWGDPNFPGSARVEELHHRLTSPETYAAFRATPDGRFLLSVLEAYEGALNDDWLPTTIFGLQLKDAQFFIGLVADEIETNGLPVAVARLEKAYGSLAKL